MKDRIIEDLIEDIKQVSYILTDNGYELNYMTKEQAIESTGRISGGFVPKFDIQLIIKLEREVYKEVIDRHLIIGELKKEPEMVKFYEDVNHFFIMLKEHLIDGAFDINLDLLTTVCIVEIKL
jgi:hypothetical protein